METYQQTENLKLFWKPETDPKKVETDERTENLQLFLKTGNWPKKEETDPKNRENESNVNIAETDPKYSEIPLHFLVFEGFPIILEKRRKRTQTHFWVRFRVEAFP